MRQRPLVWVLLLFLLVIAVWWEYHSSIQISKYEKVCEVTGEVESFEKSSSGRRAVLSDVVIYESGRQRKGRAFKCSHILIYENSKKPILSNLKIGNVITLKGTVCSFLTPGNPGQFNEYEYYQQLNISYKMFPDILMKQKKTVNMRRQFLYECREKLCQCVNNCLPEKEAGIINAMLFGDKSALSEDMKQLYQKNGIAHLLAISGLHVTILGGALFTFLRKRVMSMQWAAGVTILFLLLYGELTGFSIATSRAVIMMICMLSARIFGRSYDAVSALCLAAVITLVQKPYAFMQPGFLLSYGTVIGIIYVTPMWEDFVPFSLVEKQYGKRVTNIFRAFAGSLSVSITTLPIILYSYYEVPFYSAILNLIILPFMSVVVGLGFLAAVWGSVSYLLSRFLFGTVYYILKYYELVCHITCLLPFGTIRTGQPQMWQIVLYYVAFIVAVIVKKKRVKVMLLFFLFIIFLPKSESAVTMTVLDVGQGDGIFFESAGTVMLIDGGSSDTKEVGKYRLFPYLKQRGISHIDMIFISHPDNDHINGLLELIEKREEFGFSIGKVILPGVEKPDEAQEKLKERIGKSNVPISYMKAGGKFRCGLLDVKCLHPYQDTASEDVNDTSLVLRVSYQKFSALLVGDLEVDGEKRIVSNLCETSILKVGHHGSSSSTSEELLEAVKPKLALISAGEGNRYGHPSKEVLARLKKFHIPVLQTMKSGAVTIQSDGKKLWFSEYRKKQPS